MGASGRGDFFGVVGKKNIVPGGMVQVYSSVVADEYLSRDSATPGVRALIAPEGVIARVFQSGALPA